MIAVDQSATRASLTRMCGVLSIDRVRQAIQDAMVLGTVARDAAQRRLAQASLFQMRSRRDVGTVNLVYTLNRDIDIKFNVRTKTPDRCRLASATRRAVWRGKRAPRTVTIDELQGAGVRQRARSPQHRLQRIAVRQPDRETVALRTTRCARPTVRHAWAGIRQ